MKFAIGIFAVTLLLIIGYRAAECNAGYKEAMIARAGKSSGAPQAFRIKGAISPFSASMPEKTSQDIMEFLRSFTMIIVTFILLGASLFIVVYKKFD